MGGSVSAEAFAVLAKRAGLTLSEEQHATLHGVYGHFEAMLVRVRGAGERARGAEPAHIFVPGEGWPV